MVLKKRLKRQDKQINVSSMVKFWIEQINLQKSHLGTNWRNLNMNWVKKVIKRLFFIEFGALNDIA